MRYHRKTILLICLFHTPDCGELVQNVCFQGLLLGAAGLAWQSSCLQLFNVPEISILYHVYSYT